MDPFSIEFETVMDGGVDAGAAALSPDAAGNTTGAEGESVPSAGATEQAPAWTPEQIAALRNDPDFAAAFAEQAAEIAQAQIAPMLPLLQQLVNPDGGQQHPQFDWGQLDPLDGQFGAQLGAGINNAVQQALAPVYQALQQMQQGQQTYAAQQAEAEGNQRIDELIADEATRNGALPEKAMGLVRPLAEQYLPRYAARFGQTPRAAELAIAQAAADIRASLPAGTAHLAAVAAARTDAPGPGSGSGLVTLPDGPTSARDRVLKYAPAIQAGRGQ